MTRHINIVRAGSVCNNIEQIKEIYSNHAKLIQELLAKTSTVDTLNKEVNTLKEKQTVPPEELKSVQDELETLKKAMAEIESLRNEISTLKSDDKSDVKQELLNALNKSIPKFAVEQDEKSDDETVFDIEYFPTNPGPFYQVTKSLLPGSYKPVTAHYFPVLFQRHGILHRFYTQNIDGLDIDAGLTPDKVVECHGGFHKLRCLKCKTKFDFKEYKDELESGEIVHCHECGEGLIKPEVVFFGEPLPRRFFKLCDDDFAAADLLIVMGSSLAVSPCNELPGYVNENCVRVLINRDKVANANPPILTDGETVKCGNYYPFQFIFDSKLNKRDIYIGGDLQENCKKIIDALGWTDEYNEISGA